MKIVLFTLLIVVLAMLGIGFYMKNNGDIQGEVVIGIAVLITAFILMPLFIYDGYKKKRLSDFRLGDLTKKIEENSKEN